ncbi:hypothetical protein VTN77DRAFT_4897 [Rasamsonia byssochlamydoides]|uniref:uncharacterized protein n=1 Tax=Rasamsonia byssochlamydoides TaxID=89139 RepID=UPI00374263B7
MDDEPAKADRHLLERLNALKPSSVQLERQKKPFDFASQYSTSLGVSELDTQSRNSRLHLGVGCEHDIPPDPLFEDGDAIEDLLSSLDHGDSLPRILGVDDSDSRGILSDPSSILNCPEAAVVELGGGSVDSQFMPASDLGDCNYETASNEESDDEKAAKYVEDLLKQIGTEDRHSPLSSTAQDMKASLERNSSFNRTSRSTLEPDSLGSADVVKLERTSATPTRLCQRNDDDGLSTRFAALNLPSVPAELPGIKKAHETAPDCCCICYDSATTKCLDCEGAQLFCVCCWWEMHMGEGTDGEERQHRGVKYNPP